LRLVEDFPFADEKQRWRANVFQLALLNTMARARFGRADSVIVIDISLTIRPGYPVNVLVTRDLVLAPYNS
jgi:hypothetical protein